MVSHLRGDAQRRRELCEFLKFARSRITPSEAGITSIGRRRVAGLRRDEVAALCGISVSWYTWWESGRPDTRASARLVAAVARSLRLAADETTYLFSLAIAEMPQMESPVRGLVESMLQSIIAAWHDGAPLDAQRQCEPCDSLPLGIYCTTPDGTILYANRSLIGLLGYANKTTYLGLNAETDLYMCPGDRKLWQRDIAVVGSLRNVAANARRADGRYITVRDTATAIRRKDDSISCYLGVWEQV